MNGKSTENGNGSVIVLGSSSSGPDSGSRNHTSPAELVMGNAETLQLLRDLERSIQKETEQTEAALAAGSVSSLEEVDVRQSVTYAVIAGKVAEMEQRIRNTFERRKFALIQKNLSTLKDLQEQLRQLCSQP